ncbi:Trypsin 3A1 [Pseudolycoriella hygida]|uniref:Trypsin 3A1 n=1 Tax=Pseudolycoriella hygida TaxID=35572 RepID=A0A9Q0N8C9_9DIPT|nr:Trypsin 3A1 [Pseudolycoriella hygida]
MNWQIVSVWLLLTLLHSHVNSQQRIYGGHKIDITEAPYMVGVTVIRTPDPQPGQKVEVYNCGGTILRKNLILTAAHCNTNGSYDNIYPAGNYYITVGANTNELSDGVLHYVKKVNVHPEYKGGHEHHFFHDVAVLELTEEIELNDKAQLTELAESGDKAPVGTPVVVKGWGVNPDHNNDNHLYAVELDVISAKECIEKVAGGKVEDVEKHQICAFAPGKSHCEGDSGGPLIDTKINRQVGIVSYGAVDCTLGKPDIYTRVTDVLDFINGIIEEASG